MPITVVVGLQWGDEGKGRIADLEAKNVRYGFRWNGGPNAGHTIVHGSKKLVLHHLPATILHPNVEMSFVTGGAVINPKTLLEELEQLRGWGVNPSGRLMLDHKCLMILPVHQLLDGYLEQFKGGGGTGTTKQGIGWVYADHCLYCGVPIGYLRKRDLLAYAVEKNVRIHNAFMVGMGHPGVDWEAIFNEYWGYAKSLVPFIGNTQSPLYEAWQHGENILGEPGQGFGIDEWWAPPEYRTASANIAGSAGVSIGIPHHPDKVEGVFKGTYVTRVGQGPFPTKYTGLEVGKAERIRELGGEFGATTGRPRDVGRLDAVMVGAAIRVNGVDELAMTKIDVTAGGEIEVCDQYFLDGKPVSSYLDLDSDDLFRVEPHYVRFPGWDQNIRGITRWDQLPREAQQYVTSIEEMLGRPITMVSTGPETDQVIIRKDYCS